MSSYESFHKQLAFENLPNLQIHHPIFSLTNSLIKITFCRFANYAHLQIHYRIITFSN